MRLPLSTQVLSRGTHLLGMSNLHIRTASGFGRCHHHPHRPTHLYRPGKSRNDGMMMMTFHTWEPHRLQESSLERIMMYVF